MVTYEQFEKWDNLVHYIAHRYTKYGIDYDDCVQAGRMGLLTAFDKYSTDNGAKFITYAARVIMDKMTREVINSATVFSLTPRKRLIKNTQIKIYDVLELRGQIFGIDAVHFDSESNIDMSDDFKGVEISDLIERIHKITSGEITGLTAREREVILLLYLDGNNILNQIQIGEKLGISRQRVKQLHDKALQKLRVLLKR